MGGYISPEIIDHICQQTDIVHIISQYVALTPAGKNYKALCPFHEEKTPSFVVSPQKQVFHCFGCGIGGNIFTFLMNWESISFPQAVRTLAQKAGISVSLGDEATSHRQRLYQVNARVAEFFHHQLKRNKIAQNYLYQRGFQPEAVDLFKLGWAPSSRAFLNFCRTNNLSHEKLKQLGLVKTSSHGKGVYSYFRERIIFPIISASGKIVGFGGRVLDESLPKYINSPSSPIFDKGKNLYGLHLTKGAMRKSKQAILVEGYTDVITLHQKNIPNTVASLGTSLTAHQAQVLKRYVDTIFLAYDQDTAGEAATIRGIDLLLESELQVNIINLPSGKDPADFIREEGKRAFLQAKERALPYVGYRIKMAVDNNQPLTLERKLKVVNSLFFTLKKIKSRHTLDEMLRRLSQALDFNEESLRSEFARFCKQKDKFAFSPTLKFEVPEQEEIEKRLLQVMLYDKEAMGVAKNNFSSDSFTHPLCRRLAQEIFLYKGADNITPSYLINRVTNSNLSSLISSLSLNDSSLEGFDLQQVTRQIIQTLKRRSHQRRIEQLSRMIQDCEQRGEEQKVKDLCQQLIQLRKSILI